MAENTSKKCHKNMLFKETFKYLKGAKKWIRGEDNPSSK
jgi:hypothetical protein